MKKILLSALITALVSGMFSCKEKQQYETSTSEELKSHLLLYPPASLGVRDPIQFTFKTAVFSGLDEEDIQKFFKISPTVEGRWTITTNNSLSFLPDKPLPYNTQFTISVNPSFSDEIQTADGLPLVVRTQTERLFFDLSTEPVRITDVRGENLAELNIIIQSSDWVDEEVIGKSLSVPPDEKVSLRWSHAASGMRHSLTLSGIPRREKNYSLQIAFKFPEGEPLQKEVIIPGFDHFELMNVEVLDLKEQNIQLTFSGIIDPKQDLEGLIFLQGIDVDPVITVDGNHVFLQYPTTLTGSYVLHIYKGIRSEKGHSIDRAENRQLEFSDLQPAVRFLRSGTILPSDNQQSIPFEAVGLKAVDVEITKIKPNNVLQFLQVNKLAGNYEMERVGEQIYFEKLDLTQMVPESQLMKWNRFNIDLDSLLNSDKGAIYHIGMGFRPAYRLVNCESDQTSFLDGEFSIKSLSEVGWVGPLGYYDDFKWADREDPCKPAYYNSERFVYRNAFSSDIGLIAKRSPDPTGPMMVVATDLLSGTALGEARISLLNYQGRNLATARTNSSGWVQFEDPGEAFFVVAESNDQYGYIRLRRGESLSLSRFDVGGSELREGINGLLYGERGVWRPGDEMSFHFILHHPDGKIPANYPVTFELRDPRGQLVERVVDNSPTGPIYSFATNTSPGSETGRYRLIARAGPAEFSIPVRVETIRPNRLDVTSEINKIPDGQITIDLESSWFHGAPSPGLNYEMEVSYTASIPKFSAFPSYKFTDINVPDRPYNLEVQRGALNAQSSASETFATPPDGVFMGDLRVRLDAKVFEPGGGFSTHFNAVTLPVYSHYTGMDPGEGQWFHGWDLNEEATVSAVVVDQDGRPAPNRKVSVEIFELGWSWWWESRDERNVRWQRSRFTNLVYSAEARTASNGRMEVNYTPEKRARYYLRICDEAGHCSGEIFYAGWNYRSQDDLQAMHAQVIEIQADKEEYHVGDKIGITIPAAARGKALITVEKGQRILQKKWVDLKEGNGEFNLTATGEMFPVAHLSVHLVFPHERTHDLPLRMYGILPIKVNRGDLRLDPQIRHPDKIRPEQDFEVIVKEGKGQAMAYTIAIVDEGLLSLTNHRMPDPESSIYVREALGVMTWDIFNDVAGAYSAAMERVFSIGGDRELEVSADEMMENRFPPVVLTSGPHFLEKGQSSGHSFKLQPYIGRVRVMVMAASTNGKYGKYEGNMEVSSPLILLAGLPRLLGTGEEVNLPVQLFFEQQSGRNIEITIEDKTGLLEFPNGNKLRIPATGNSPATVFFKAITGAPEGIAQLHINASSGSHKSGEVVNLPVRNPIYPGLFHRSISLNPGESANLQGYGKRDRVLSRSLDISTFKGLPISKLREQFYHYGHYCLEQRISMAVAAISIAAIENRRLSPIENDMIFSTLEEMRSRYIRGRGYALWRGQNDADEWVSVYAGLMLYAAREAGYLIPNAMISNWISDQSAMARNFTMSRTGVEGAFQQRAQAFRLYVLSLFDAPEQGAMNRLVQAGSRLDPMPSVLLAGAYQILQNPIPAGQLLDNFDFVFEPYQEHRYTYGNQLRDRALALLILLDTDRFEKIETVREILIDDLRKLHFTTQANALALYSLSRYLQKYPPAASVNAVIQCGDFSELVETRQVLTTVDISGRNGCTLKNDSDGVIHLQLKEVYTILPGEETASSNQIEIRNEFFIDGKKMVRPGSINRGQQLELKTTIRQVPGPTAINLDNIALTQYAPSGFEIENRRLNEETQAPGSDYTFKDIRDDRVISYFSLQPGELKTYHLLMTAGYSGKYYFPGPTAEALYDNRIRAAEKGWYIEILKPESR